jgi:hypothetical protein
VTWTFAGGMTITDTSTYTAVLAPALDYVDSCSGNYPNGDSYIGTTVLSGQDLLFQATFSAATPVPFEFSPALGLVGLGVLWAGRKFLLNNKL